MAALNYPFSYSRGPLSFVSGRPLDFESDEGYADPPIPIRNMSPAALRLLAQHQTNNTAPTKPSSTTSRRIMLSYDSNLTGSKDLRCDNILNVYEFLTNKVKQLSPIGEYAFAYDKSKKNEPMYDGFLACIALLDNPIFDKNFKIVPVTYHDGAPEDDPRVSRLSTCVNYDYIVDREYIDYKEAKHVFLMAPFTRAALEYIRSLESETGTIIFHVQGEATCKDYPEQSTVAYPHQMTSHGNLFGAAFNLWTGEQEAYMVRQLMTETYTVKLKPFTKKPVELPNNIAKPPTFVAHIPPILINFREYMVNDCLLQTKYWRKAEFINLDIIAIFQDMLDKDNLIACWVLLNYSMMRPLLSVVGRRVYNCDDDVKLVYWTADPTAIELSHYKDGKYSMSENGEIQFPIAHKPNTKILKTNDGVNVTVTRDNHIFAKKSFLDVLTKAGLSFTPLDDVDLEIVDGLGETAPSRRCPFYEKMLTSVSFMGDAKQRAFDKYNETKGASNSRRALAQAKIINKESQLPHRTSFLGGGINKRSKRKKNKRTKRIKSKRRR